MASPYRKNEALVTGLSQRDRNAIEYFFRRYFHGLKLYVGEDEDIAMEAFEIALEKISEYNPVKGKFITWVYRIGRNLFLKRKRREEQAETVFAEDLLESYDEEDTGGSEREEWIKPNPHTQDDLYSNFLKTKFIDADTRQQIGQAIKRLSRKERQVLADYCEKSGKKFSDQERKTVFKKLRVHLKAIQDAEEEIALKRLS